MPPALSAKKRPEPPSLEQSQKKLYLSLKKELSLYEKKKPRELLAYERSFRATLPRRRKASSRRRLLRAIEGANVVLVGDFHPFRQSQKGFLRLAEGAAHFRPPGSAIALECFQQAHQTAVNEYLAGLITAEELRDKIDFDRYWPFAWESYREILAYARQNTLPVLALNITGPRGKEPPLVARDAAAAERITRHLAEHPRATVFALYGELHLGQRHLPAELRERLGRRSRIVTVHQNDADLYWQAPTGSDGLRPEVLELGAAEFCILNSVPWVKLRSYLDWLEGSPTPDVEEEDIDVVGVVHHYARLLAEALGLHVPLDDSVEILPPNRLGSRGLPAGLKGLSRMDRELARHALTFHRTGYLPTRPTLILPTVSTNAMAEAAALLLRHSLLPAATEPAARWGTEEWVSHFLLGYLGSKILNPKRKCNEVADLQRAAAVGKRVPRRIATSRLVAERALFLLRPLLRDLPPPPRRKRLPQALEMEACRAAGFVLGERFFLALLTRPRLIERLKKMFRAAPGHAVLADAQAGLVKLRRAAKSKRERF